MTFETNALAIDGTLLKGAMLRRASFVGASGQSGVVLKPDLKVTQLTVPGVGIKIATGVGVVRNGYQSTVNEAYIVSNPSEHIIPSGEMPGASGSAKYYIVAIVVGDKDFSQTGHPFMLSTDPPIGTENTFVYVRPKLIEVSAGATTLPGAYPALVLARIDVPPSTTTITNAMITDLRTLVRPRQSQEAFISPGGTWTNASPQRIPAAAAYSDWGAAQYSPSVLVPSWATRAIVMVSINGVRVADTSANISGNIRAKIGTATGTATAFDYATGGGAVRDNIMAAGSFDVSALAGTSQVLKVEGFENVPASPSNNQRLRLETGSQMIFDVRFFEE